MACTITVIPPWSSHRHYKMQRKTVGGIEVVHTLTFYKPNRRKEHLKAQVSPESHPHSSKLPLSNPIIHSSPHVTSRQTEEHWDQPRSTDAKPWSEDEICYDESLKLLFCPIWWPYFLSIGFAGQTSQRFF
jgi:hypothetical protein